MRKNEKFVPEFTIVCEEWLTPSEKAECLAKFNNEISKYTEEELKKEGICPEDIWDDIQTLALYNPDTNLHRVKEAVAVGRDFIVNANKTLRTFTKYKKTMSPEETLVKCKEALIWNGSLCRSEEAKELLDNDSVYSTKFKSLLDNLGFDLKKNGSLSLIELAELINEAFELIKDEHMSTLSPQQWSAAIANELQACTDVYYTSKTYAKRKSYKHELERFLERESL